MDLTLDDFEELDNLHLLNRSLYDRILNKPTTEKIKKDADTRIDSFILYAYQCLANKTPLTMLIGYFIGSVFTKILLDKEDIYPNQISDMINLVDNYNKVSFTDIRNVLVPSDTKKKIKTPGN